jgi:hypothetical protein
MHIFCEIPLASPFMFLKSILRIDFTGASYDYQNIDYIKEPENTQIIHEQH